MTTKELAAQLSNLENTLVAGNTVATYTYEYEQREQVPHGLKIAVLQVLNASDVAHPHALQHTLKQVNSAAISTAVKQLENSGMVKREHIQSDHRVVDITITQKGREYLQAIGIDWKDVIADELTDKYSESEIKTITRFLSNVSDAITKQVQQNSEKPFAERIEKEMH